MARPVAKATFDDAESRMREILSSAELPDPDEVIRDAANEELVLLWHEQRLVLTIELDPRVA